MSGAHTGMRGPFRRRRAGLGGVVVALLVGLYLSRAQWGRRLPSFADPAAAAEAGAGARTGPYEVLRVVDGDTLHVRIPGSPTPDERVRLLRVNTPERGQPGYERATACLIALTADRRVELEWERPGVAERDEYGRLLAYVHAGGVLVNEELVRQGFSRFFTKYGGGRLADRFRAAEEEARAARRGLWTAGGFNVAR
ncbi:MAG TPA: thermonuclease family protein [Planctomycetota bacterium]|nr:thermonuclease family protein [Planctomycetota bacterium]